MDVVKKKCGVESEAYSIKKHDDACRVPDQARAPEERRNQKKASIRY